MEIKLDTQSEIGLDIVDKYMAASLITDDLSLLFRRRYFVVFHTRNI